MNLQNRQHFLFCTKKKKKKNQLQAIVYNSDGEEWTPIPTNKLKQDAKGKIKYHACVSDFNNRVCLSIHI